MLAVALAIAGGLTAAAVMTGFERRDGVAPLTAFAAVATVVAWRAHPAASALSGFLVASFWNFLCLRPYAVLHANGRVAVGTAIVTAAPLVVSLGREGVAWVTEQGVRRG
ncbi:MAG: hypothetical protein QOE45_263 [Frankiaceae bacterium]|nr:hypothetical protein [Frankiaceae bacterium]